MKAALPLAVLLMVFAAACDKPKPRPAADARAAHAPPAAPQPMSAGLVPRPEMPGFSLDRINAAQDPVNVPATIRSGTVVEVSGFGFDPVAKAAGKGVDIVIDGVAYPTDYGHERQDVAVYFKTEAVRATGFRASLPAGVVTPGPHKAQVRVISADGGSYFDGVAIDFYAQ